MKTGSISKSWIGLCSPFGIPLSDSGSTAQVKETRGWGWGGVCVCGGVRQHTEERK